MNSTQVNSQRTVTFTTAQGKRRPDKINKSATIILICVSRKLVIKPAETALLDTKIQVELPEGPVGALVVLPIIQSLILKLQNGYSIQGKQILTFRLLNQSFSRRFTFRKSDLIGSLIILNQKLNERFTVEYKTLKKAPRKRKTKK